MTCGNDRRADEMKAKEQFAQQAGEGLAGLLALVAVLEQANDKLAEENAKLKKAAVSVWASTPALHITADRITFERPEVDARNIKAQALEEAAAGMCDSASVRLLRQRAAAIRAGEVA